MLRHKDTRRNRKRHDYVGCCGSLLSVSSTLMSDRENHRLTVVHNTTDIDWNIRGGLLVSVVPLVARRVGHLLPGSKAIQERNGRKANDVNKLSVPSGRPVWRTTAGREVANRRRRYYFRAPCPNRPSQMGVYLGFDP